MRELERSSRYWSLVKAEPDLLELHGSGAGSGSCLLLLGALFLGVPTLLHGPRPLALFGLVMLGLGLVLCCTRSTAVLDKRRNTLRYHRREITGSTSWERSLSDFDEVHLGTEFVSGESRSSGHWLCFVDLVDGSGDTLRLGARRKLAESDDETDMRRLAERLARLLEVPLRASFSGEEVVSAPDELDRTLGDKFPEATPPLQPPPTSAIRVTHEGDRIRYLLPPEGYRGLNRFFLLVAGGSTVFSLLVFGLLATTVAAGGETEGLPPAAALLLSGLLAGFSFLMLAAAVGKASRQDELVLAPGELARTVIFRGRRYPRERLDPAEVEDLRRDEGSRHPLIPGEPPLLVISDRHILRVGGWLGAEDSAWLLDELRGRVVARSKPG